MKIFEKKVLKYSWNYGDIAINVYICYCLHRTCHFYIFLLFNLNLKSVLIKLSQLLIVQLLRGWISGFGGTYVLYISVKLYHSKKYGVNVPQSAGFDLLGIFISLSWTTKCFLKNIGSVVDILPPLHDSMLAAYIET